MKTNIYPVSPVRKVFPNMQSFFNWLDSIADINAENPLAKWLERIAFLFLILMILAAPHSIAATQTAWLAGMFAWFLRLFVSPRPKLVRSPLDIALWTFFGWTILTAVFSYAPDISADKLRNAALFLIFYFIINVVRTRRAVFFLAFALIFSTMFVALWTPVERIIGRGVQVSGIKAESPLAKAILLEGDTLLEANKRKVRMPQDLVEELNAGESVEVIVNRQDFNFAVTVKRADLLPGELAEEKLGIGDWQRSHVWRAQGFFSHFTTFAEVLQLVASLAFGLLISFLNFRSSRSDQVSESQNSNLKSQILQPKVVLLAVSFAAIIPALLLTVTRASQLAFLVSAAAIILFVGNRKLIFTLAALMLPLALIGVFLLEQNRQVSFFDSKDGSTEYRLMMYRDGVRLWTASARNFTVGVGMDSVKRYWREWDLYDKGWQPMGHFHSTPLQLAVERGFPAVIFWFWILWLYARMLWRELKFKVQSSNPKSQTPNPKSIDWRERGVLLGAFGGLIGFFTSGLVHYNYGDAVTAMMFFIIMGLSVRLVVSGEVLFVNSDRN
jgi:hypothetical protein